MPTTVDIWPACVYESERVSSPNKVIRKGLAQTLEYLFTILAKQIFSKKMIILLFT